MMTQSPQQHRTGRGHVRQEIPQSSSHSTVSQSQQPPRRKKANRKKSIEFSTIATEVPWRRSQHSEQEAYVPSELSLRLPRRRGSICGGSDSEEEDSVGELDPMLSSSSHHSIRYTREDSSGCLHHPMSPTDLHSPSGRYLGSTYNFRRQVAQDEDQLFAHRTTQRRSSMCGPRPCITIEEESPAVRRVSIGGTRPCMERSLQLDDPIMRPYRQLSSEDLCEELCVEEEEGDFLDESVRSARRAACACSTNFVAEPAAPPLVALPSEEEQASQNTLPVVSNHKSNHNTLSPASPESELPNTRTKKEKCKSVPLPAKSDHDEHRPSATRSSTLPTNITTFMRRLSITNHTHSDRDDYEGEEDFYEESTHESNDDQWNDSEGSYRDSSDKILQSAKEYLDAGPIL